MIGRRLSRRIRRYQYRVSLGALRRAELGERELASPDTLQKRSLAGQQAEVLGSAWELRTGTFKWYSFADDQLGIFKYFNWLWFRTSQRPRGGAARP